jgi:hypothetical protein
MVSARAVLLLMFVSSVAVAQQHRPTVLLSADRVLVALPDAILKDQSVRNRLESALTTTFILKSRLRGAGSESIVRIEIRYDLWDAIYRVARIEAQNRGAPQQIAKTQLEQWWHTPVEIARLAADRATVDIELVVLPFSSAEESDAREWLSKSGGARDPSSDAKSIVDVLIGTTLSARPIVSYHWSAEIVRR